MPSTSLQKEGARLQGNPFTSGARKLILEQQPVYRTPFLR